jgi:hypothetical protein
LSKTARCLGGLSAAVGLKMLAASGRMGKREY